MTAKKPYVPGISIRGRPADLFPPVNEEERIRRMSPEEFGVYLADKHLAQLGESLKT